MGCQGQLGAGLGGQLHMDSGILSNEGALGSGEEELGRQLLV